MANEIRHGFVECLESDLPVFTVDDSDVESALENGDEIELTIKEEIIKLLEECLPHSAPNISHYLLGFDITLPDIRATLLQQPGVLDFPSNCTKSLITILNEGVQRLKFGIEIPFIQKRILQTGYRLLYTLCSNHETSEVILRYLRECKEFLLRDLRHISVLPFQHYELNQMTGLLKCVATDEWQVFSEPLDGGSDEPDIFYVFMDIHQPIEMLKKSLQKQTKKNLTTYEVRLQNVQVLETFHTLVDQCVKGGGLVQVNAQILDHLKRINIADVVEPAEEVDDAMKSIDLDENDIVMHENDPRNSNDSSDCKFYIFN